MSDNERMELLEELCKEMYRDGCYFWALTNHEPPYARLTWAYDFMPRMDELGLLEVDDG